MLYRSLHRAYAGRAAGGIAGEATVTGGSVMGKFYPRDSINGEGAIEGHPEEIEMDYRIAASIAQGEFTYTYTGMRGGKAIYKKGIKSADKPEKVALPKIEYQTDDREIPTNAILHYQFVGRNLWQNGIKYQHMTPPRQLADGRWVYVPA